MAIKCDLRHVPAGVCNPLQRFAVASVESEQCDLARVNRDFRPGVTRREGLSMALLSPKVIAQVNARSTGEVGVMSWEWILRADGQVCYRLTEVNGGGDGIRGPRRTSRQQPRLTPSPAAGPRPPPR